MVAVALPFCLQTICMDLEERLFQLRALGFPLNPPRRCFTRPRRGQPGPRFWGFLAQHGLSGGRAGASRCGDVGPAAQDTEQLRTALCRDRMRKHPQTLPPAPSPTTAQSSEAIPRVRAMLLGAAQDGGVPHIGCHCANCEAARTGAAPPQWAVSLCVVVEPAGGQQGEGQEQQAAKRQKQGQGQQGEQQQGQGGASFWIFDATPDIKQQVRMTRCLIGHMRLVPGCSRQRCRDLEKATSFTQSLSRMCSSHTHSTRRRSASQALGPSWGVCSSRTCTVGCSGGAAADP